MADDMYFMRVVSEDVITPADLLGKKVIIRATTQLGSVSILNGLTGIVIAPHPIAPRWVKIRLDPNEITPLEEWPVPEDRLVVAGLSAATPIARKPMIPAQPQSQGRQEEADVVV
jgi:hypothetical protein